MGKLTRVPSWSLHDGALVPVALVVVVIAAGVGLLSLTNLYPTIPDSIGYVYAGQQLAQGEGLSHHDPLNRELAPLFYLHSFRAVETGSPRASFGYPPGYPILIAFIIVVSGSIRAALYANSLFALLALIATYFLGRSGGQFRWTSLAATLTLAASVSLWRFGTEPWSELPSLVMIALGALAFLRSRDQEQGRRQRGWWAVLAGLLFGYALLLRLTNLILLSPALIATDLAQLEFRLTRKSLLHMGWGWGTYAVIGQFLVVDFFYNWLVLGGPLNSIYSTPELGAYPWPLFSLGYAFGDSPIGNASLLRSLETLWDNFSLLLPFALVGWWRMGRTSGLFAAMLSLSAVALYSVYAFPPLGVNARFLLPAFPFIAAGIAGGLEAVCSHLPTPILRATIPVAFLALLALLWHSIPGELDQRNKTASQTVSSIKELVATSPGESVWLSAAYNDIITYYGNRSTLNYRRALQAAPGSDGFDVSSMEGCVVDALSALLRKSIPVYFIPESGWGIDRILADYFTLEAETAAYVQIRETTAPPSPPPDCNYRFLR